MANVFSVGWEEMFVPSLGLLEVILRGTLMFFALFAILRFVGRRQVGQLGAADLLVMVLIADAAQNAMGGEYKSVTEGTLLVLTIVFWDYAIDWLAFRFPALRHILQLPPITLVADGKPVDRNLQSELMTMDELMSQLRQQGIDSLEAVKKALLEGDGHVSVIERRIEPRVDAKESRPRARGGRRRRPE